MFKKSAAIFITITCLSLAACSSTQPKLIQAATGSPEIVLTVGMATQIEMPDQARVTSLTVGNPAMVTAEQGTDVVNLLAKGETGETNLIIRSRDENDRIKVYQYHITVKKN